MGRREPSAHKQFWLLSVVAIFYFAPHRSEDCGPSRRARRRTGRGLESARARRRGGAPESVWKVALGARGQGRAGQGTAGQGGAGVVGSRDSAAAPCRRSWKLTPASERGAGLRGALERVGRGWLAGRLSTFLFLSRALFLDLRERRPGEAWGRTGYRQGGSRRERQFVTWIRHPSRSV